MMTKCWRCKGSIDTTKVDTVETIGLCQPCWDNSSAEPAKTLPNEPIADVQKRLHDSLKVPEEHRGHGISPEQFVHDPPWDDTEVRPKVPSFSHCASERLKDKIFVEPSTSALEHRVAAQRTEVKEQTEKKSEQKEPKKSGVDFEELQRKNDPSFGTDMSTFFDRSPFHSTIGMARLEQELGEAIRNATQKFRNKNFDDVRDEVRKISVDVLLKNTPNGFPTPPRELIEGLVDKCLDRQFGPRGSTQATNYRV
jgi:hypothetical protein